MQAHGAVISGAKSPHGSIGGVGTAYMANTAVTVINHFAGNFSEWGGEPVLQVKTHSIPKARNRFFGPGLATLQVKVHGSLQCDGATLRCSFLRIGIYTSAHRNQGFLSVTPCLRGGDYAVPAKGNLVTYIETMRAD